MLKNKVPDLPSRARIVRGFGYVEDSVYVGLGFLLSASAIVLLVSGIVGFFKSLLDGSFTTSIVTLLDRILLVLLIVELLYTVQVSFRTHSLLPEPFLLVGLIAVIRRVLVVTAEFKQVSELTESMSRRFLLELALLMIMILAITISLVLLRKHKPTPDEFASS